MNGRNGNRPHVYIEERFPTELLNEQVQQETGSTPFNNVHRWFSRKPLSFSRASVLGSILPASISKDEFDRLLGMPQYGRVDVRLYQQTPSEEIIARVQECALSTWGRNIEVLDAFAGGGSIPFEAVRYSLNTRAYDLNPVAVATMLAAIDVPATTGEGLIADLRHWVKWIGEQAQERLSQYYLAAYGERTRDYLWAHTARCPECGLSVPLSPTWWVDSSAAARKVGRACAVRMIVPTKEDGDVCLFEMVSGTGKDGKIDGYDPNDAGTLARATGRCPRCRGLLAREYLWEEGQAGRLGYQMYAVVYHNAQRQLSFRVPTESDLAGALAANGYLQQAESDLVASDLIPSEPITADTWGSRWLHGVGLFNWRDLFTARQLLAQVTLLDLVQQAITKHAEKAPEDKNRALALWLAMILDRCADKNCRLGRWDHSFTKVQNASATHALNLMWNFPELNGASRLWQLCADTVTGDYEKLCRLARHPSEYASVPSVHPACLTIDTRDAADLFDTPDQSITAIVTDPPYYSSIRYAEIADMYYVWQKRALQAVLPDLYVDELTNKELETISDVGRFRSMANPEELADRDYEAKLVACQPSFITVRLPGSKL